MEHKKCIEEGFNSCLEEVGIFEVSQGDEVSIDFEEYCDSCGKLIGRERQYFKYIDRTDLEVTK